MELTSRAIRQDLRFPTLSLYKAMTVKTPSEARRVICPARLMFGGLLGSGLPALFSRQGGLQPYSCLLPPLAADRSGSQVEATNCPSKLASVSGVFQPGLDIRLFTRFQVPAKRYRWLLPTDTHTRLTSQPSLTAVCVLSVEAGRSGCILTHASWTSRAASPVLKVSPAAPAPFVVRCWAPLVTWSCPPRLCSHWSDFSAMTWKLNSFDSLPRLITRPLPSTKISHGLGHPQQTMMAGVGRSLRPGNGWCPCALK